MKFVKNKRILIIMMILFFIIPINSYADEITLTSEVTEEFEKWNDLNQEEKEKTQLPEICAIEIPKKSNKLDFKESKNILKFFKEFENTLGSKKSELEKYSLIEDIDVKIKNQGITGQCWAFSVLSSMEANIALNKNIEKDFSERHMAYATSKNFIDGENKKGYNKKVNEYGLQTIALAYLTNGQGAVLEEQMPFENNENEIYLKQIDIEKDTYVTDYEVIPSIYKKHDNNNNLIYHNGNGIVYTEKEVENIRKQIKEHIVKYGAISAVTASQKTKYYNNENDIKLATSYYCNDDNIVRDHAVTIIGWDDNYSKENFNPNNKPVSDGAYIVLNSYGQETFDGGYIYISYEDILIETSLYGVCGTSNEEYYNIYQHDFYGGIANLGTKNKDTGYYANIYKRDIKEEEKLTKIGVTISDYVKLNIYVNPIDDEVSNEKLKKIGTTEVLNPGYHTIDIEDVNLKNERFAVVVEQISENNKFMFSIETCIENSVYDIVTAEKGNSKISFDGSTWYNLSDLGVISGIDTSKSDICIKAFTEKIKETEQPDLPDEPEQPEIGEKITSQIYNINNGYIKNIEYYTTFEKFLENIEATSEVLIYENGIEINRDDVLKTGMILKLKEKEYSIVVSGDLNGDGKISLIDISKLVLHYNGKKEFQLNGPSKEAGDMNYDNKISLIDISKLIVLFNKIP